MNNEVLIQLGKSVAGDRICIPRATPTITAIVFFYKIQNGHQSVRCIVGNAQKYFYLKLLQIFWIQNNIFLKTLIFQLKSKMAANT